MKRYAKFSSLLLCKLDKTKVIRTCHIRESWTKLFHVRTDKRIWKMIDMVSDDHEITDLIVEIDATCRIRDEKILNAKHFHHTDRQCDKFHRITFIKMEAALHCHHELASKLSCYEITLMSDSCRDRKARDFLIWNHSRILNLIRKLAQAAAENDSCKWFSSVKSGCNIICRSHYSFNSRIHIL